MLVVIGGVTWLYISEGANPDFGFLGAAVSLSFTSFPNLNYILSSRPDFGGSGDREEEPPKETASLSMCAAASLASCLSLFRVAYQQQIFMAPSSGGWRLDHHPRSRWCRCSIWWRPSSRVQTVRRLLTVSSHGGMDKTSLWSLFYRSLIPFVRMRVPPLWPKLFPQSPHRLQGLGFQHVFCRCVVQTFRLSPVPVITVTFLKSLYLGLPKSVPEWSHLMLSTREGQVL